MGTGIQHSCRRIQRPSSPLGSMVSWEPAPGIFFFFLDLVKALQTRPKEGRKTRASEPTDLGRNLFPLKARLVEG